MPISLFSCLKSGPEAGGNAEGACLTTRQSWCAHQHEERPNVAARAAVEVLSLEALSLRHGASTAGVVVLAYRPTLGHCKYASKPQDLVPVYCNESASNILGSLSTTNGASADKIVGILKESEPKLFRDIVTHLLRVSAADPAGSLTIYYAPCKYDCIPAAEGKSLVNTGGETSYSDASTARGGVPNRKSPSGRSWEHALVEPLFFANTALNEDTRDACRGVQAPPGPLQLSKLWRITSRKQNLCAQRGSKAPSCSYSASAVWPAVMVTFVRAPEPCRPERNRTDTRPQVAVVHVPAGPSCSLGSGRRSLVAEPVAVGRSSNAAFARKSSASITPATLQKQCGVTQLVPMHASAESQAVFKGAEDIAHVGGEQLQLREGMVLSCINPIVTAFTSDGETVLYQNAKSVLYFGHRVPLVLEGPGAGIGSCSGGPRQQATSVLAELFGFEPAKLERMLMEVAVEGRVWKGIVQVPTSYHPSLSPLAEQKGQEDSIAPCPTAAAATHLGGHQAIGSDGTGSIGAKTSLPIGRAQGAPQLATVAAAAGARPSTLSRLSAVMQPAGGSRDDGGGGCAAVATCGDAAYSSILTVPGGTANIADTVPCVEASAYQRLSFNVDVDPLATSTWGLLMDASEQPAPMDTLARVPFNSFIKTLGVTSMDSGCMNPAGSITAPIGSPSPLKTAVPVLPQQQQEQRQQQSKAAASAAAVSYKPLATAPKVPSSSQGVSAHQQPQQILSGSALQLMRSVSVAEPSISDAAVSQDCGDADTAVVPRSLSMFLNPSIGLARGGSPRRVKSRVDLGHGRSVPRVVAFASSLKTMPSAGQAMLQLAMSGGAIVGGPHGSSAGGGRCLGAEELNQDGGSYRDVAPSAASSLHVIRAVEMFGRSSMKDGGGTADARLVDPPGKGHHLMETSNSTHIRTLCDVPAALHRQRAPLARSTPRFARTRSCCTHHDFRDHLFSSARNEFPVRPRSLLLAESSKAEAPASEAPDGGHCLSIRSRSGGGVVSSGQHRVEAMHSANATSVLGAGGVGLSGGCSTSKSPPDKVFTPTAKPQDYSASANPRSNPSFGTNGCSCVPDRSDSEPEGRRDHQTVSFGLEEASGHRYASAAARFGDMKSWLGVASEPAYAWHEVSSTRTIDPVTGQHAIVVMQIDVTAKVEAERHLAFVTEAEHRLLEQVFPRHVLAYMTEEGGPWAAQTRGDTYGDNKSILRDINALATSHTKVTLLFADIQGFTPMCKVLEPRVVMAFLNDLFTRFDQRLDEFGVYKVETIGDCYFVAGGLIREDEHGMSAVRADKDQADPYHALKVFMFAKAMLEAAAQTSLPTTGGPVRMRIGIHSGPVVSGVVGQRMPRFCLFGDTVNTASRMESTGVQGCIHASEAAWELLHHEAWVPTGGIEAKGKGLMNTYLWAPPDPSSQALLVEHVRRSRSSRSVAADANTNVDAAPAFRGSPVDAASIDPVAVCTITGHAAPDQPSSQGACAGADVCGLGGGYGTGPSNTLCRVRSLAQVWPSRPRAENGSSDNSNNSGAPCSVTLLVD